MDIIRGCQMLVKLLCLSILIILFNGCSQKSETAPEVKIVEKKVYIKAKGRILVNLPKIEVYDITDISDYNATHKIVNDEQLKKASKVSMERLGKIIFYENQNRGIDVIK